MQIAILEREPLFASGLKSLISEVAPDAEFADTVRTIEQLDGDGDIRAAFIGVPAAPISGKDTIALKSLRRDLAVCGIFAKETQAAPDADFAPLFQKIIYRDDPISRISETCRRFFENDVPGKSSNGRRRGKAERSEILFRRNNIRLAPRQVEALRHIVEGKTNPEIAAEMGISVNTVRGYISCILIALNAANRTQAAIFGQDYLLSRRPRQTRFAHKGGISPANSSA